MEQLYGSKWGVWDLQVQTILDGDYRELKDYCQDLKAADSTKWAEFIALAGTEQDALLFDSKQYFNQGEGSARHRSDNYARNLFRFLKVYAPHLACIGVTDHNHLHDELMDSLVRISKDFDCKVLPGTELNVAGVHVLAFFPHPPCNQDSFSKGIKSFLGTLQVFNTRNDSGVYSLAQGSVQEVLNKIKEQHGIYVFAHCNSDNGLFQERGKTDRTYLAEVFNHDNPVLLQTRNKDSADTLIANIKTRPNLQSKPIITIASDARALREYGKRDNANNYCYIKGAATVEGLRQALYEPETRLHLGSTEPVPPIHRIEKLDLRFPDGTKLKEDQFCLAGNRTFTFSPNYTCLIGGRGTGKSTLLELIRDKVIPRSSGSSAPQKILTSDGKVLVSSEHAKIDDDLDKKNIDYLSQNEIEKFASDAQALTAALYSRLEKENQGKLKKAQETLTLALNTFQGHIDSFREKQRFSERLATLQKEQQSQEKILNSFQSETYKNLSAAVATESNRLRALQVSKQRLAKIVGDIEKLIPGAQSKTDQASEKNDYDLAFERVVAGIRSAKEIVDGLDRVKLKAQEDQLEEQLRASKEKLSAYLAEKGLKPESLQDVADANENISRLKSEIEEAQAALVALAARVSAFTATSLNDSKTHYETTLTEQIRAINARLENLNAQVKSIKLEFRFDYDTAKRAIFEEVKKVFSLNPSSLGTKEPALQEALFLLEPNEVDLKEGYLEVLERKPKGRDLPKSQSVLIDLFQSDSNFEIYKLIIKKALSDSFSFKVISVYYDGKLLPESSFGQRCTAALVLLLLLGNNPIVIDEPEGHLDSLLIANYLVELIKEAKKHRQIIFATHNANLVVNGDADLIYHLEMMPDKKSKVTAVTLENAEERHRIVSLEGGDEAFKKRENKYRKRKQT